MASPDILSQTLQTVTGLKLGELGRNKTAHEAAKQALLRQVDQEAAEGDQAARARLLLAGVDKMPTMKTLAESPVVSTANLRRFVEQSERDPSVSDYHLLQCQAAIRAALDVQSTKYDYASLYGQLVEEWISARDDGSKNDDDDDDHVPEELRRQREVWEGYVFRAEETDGEAIAEHLRALFADASSPDLKRAFKALRGRMDAFQDAWDKKVHFDVKSVTAAIKTMLRPRAGVLTDTKRATVNEFLANDVVLAEIADVLNLRMNSLQSFAWEGVSVVRPSRQLDGHYRFFPDEDLLQMIFLHYVGRSWGVHMKATLKAFFAADGVEKQAAPVPAEDLRRREYFLGKDHKDARTVSDIKRNQWLTDIFLDQLPDAMAEERGAYGADADADSDADTRKSHVAVIQDLLHLLQSDIIVQTRLGNEVTVIRSDFKWFGPSVPHSSVLAVLAFFGVRPGWLDFFRKVLRAPMKFSDDGDDAAPARPRARGTPVSDPISDFFNETMLFCADFAVNQRADGALLYRLHDDIWLWGDVDTCVRGWKALTDFAQLMGLSFNEEKTGCARITRDGAQPAGAHPPELPQGDIVWGFLKLDPATGRFVINQKKVDEHIEELARQLRACKSVLDFIQAWNVYGVRFFRTNCGALANCYGRAHVDAILALFQTMQRRVFRAAAGGGSVAAHVKALLRDRFGGVDDVPDGFLFFPVALGGLDLHNPFVDYYLVRGNVIEDVDKVVDDYLESEAARYAKARERFDNGGAAEARKQHPDLQGEPFMSPEEFSRHRDRTDGLLASALSRLMSPPAPEEVSIGGDVRVGLGGSAKDLTSAQKWIVQLYGRDMMARFGGLNIVDKGLLPMGLMDMLRKNRPKWQG